MKPFFGGLLLGMLAAGAPASPLAELTIPTFPAPPLVGDANGEPTRTGVMRLTRELMRGGVRDLEKLEAVDSDYALLDSDALAQLSTWLEATCAGIGRDIGQARTGAYDGAIYARLLGCVTSMASTRQRDTTPLAIPVGVLICTREKPWGALPGDRRRDAYVLFATDRGFYVYDPPTRQVAELAAFPNNTTVIRVRL